ncbi:MULTISPECIES: F0F1 ATP synthase subunit gamma [Microvirgula]|uniref:ATP synthase gamma chain n=1 Tax=Microvirgula aerodenitrificans TaxID=57480 RepID=A0A2S0P9E5_9NEIS|nr:MULTISPECIES: F0F1 ATP synthase subunit gamma [Microvirgula]AVY94034.1 F0F1 ATP synthase subunit gamma [Microvirgula aerodenitrificans]RAS13861.1 ATP synthase F1 subcomplex gamma subunit [Microvirgula sp. AG722]
MAVGKEIRTKIKSVEGTQKITRAMQMVATSKMRKTQARMRAARPYAEKVREVMAHVAETNPDFKHPALQTRESVKRVGVILVSSDKGLCGGLNANVLRTFYQLVDGWSDKGVEVDVCCFGQKGFAALTRLKMNVVSSATQLGDTPQQEKLIGPASKIVRSYLSGDIDELHIVYSKFVNTMKQEPKIEQLLPLRTEELESEFPYSWDYLYEPDVRSVLDILVRRYLESVVFQAVAENMASEQAARMVAMKAATDNAAQAIERLKLTYNKARQAAITTELSEIVAGAAAV